MGLHTFIGHYLIFNILLRERLHQRTRQSTVETTFLLLCTASLLISYRVQLAKLVKRHNQHAGTGIKYMVSMQRIASTHSYTPYCFKLIKLWILYYSSTAAITTFAERTALNFESKWGKNAYATEWTIFSKELN